MLDLAVDLTTALGAALVPASRPPSTDGDRDARTISTARTSGAKTAGLTTGGTTVPPVFQMAALPEIIDPAVYANAHSNLNPNGSYLALRALRDLVDPVPLFSRTYQPSLNSTEGVWGSVIAGATGSTAFARGVVGTARQTFADSALSGTDGIPGTWRPVYTTPGVWTDLTNDAAFRKVTVDLTGAATGPTSTKLSTIGGGEAVMQWTVVDSTGATTTAPIASATTLDSLVLDVRAVSLQRPWLPFSVFATAGIEIDGLDYGALSSGDVDDNDGAMPLLPASFWLVRSVTINGRIAPSDQKVLAEAGDDTHVTLGGIAVAGSAADAPRDGGTSGQVIAWTSTLVPCWPK